MNKYDHDRRMASFRKARPTVSLCLAVLCASLTFGTFSVQANLAPPDLKAKRKTAAQQKATAGAQPIRPGKRPGRPTSRFEMDPNSKWACDQMTITTDPIWRGASTVKFPFKIRNEGTAALHIRAKGG